MLDLEAQIPAVFGDITDADMVTELEVGRKMAVVVVIDF